MSAPPSDKRILVTGSQGFLGRCLVEHLRTLRYEVVATGRRPEAGITLLDLSDAAAVAEAVAAHQPDWIVHAAAAVPQTLEEYRNEDAGRASILMTANVVAARPKRLLFISSMTVYGNPEISPVSEDVTGHPQTAYAAAKAEAERLVAESGISGYAARIPGLYGPGRDGGLVKNLAAALKQGRRPTLPEAPLVWSAMDVRDAASALARLLATSPSDFRPVNIGYAGEASIDHMVKALSDLAGSDMPYAVRHPVFTYDLDRYRSLTGDRPKSLEKAYEELWGEC